MAEIGKRLVDRPWTPRQLKAILLLGRGRTDYGNLANELGVNRNTLLKWRKRPTFQEAIYQEAMRLLHDDVPDILGALSRKARMGDIKGIELTLKHLGRYTEESRVHLDGQGTLEVEVDLSELSAREDESGD